MMAQLVSGQLARASHLDDAYSNFANYQRCCDPAFPKFWNSAFAYRGAMMATGSICC
jgi:hypothetical protein